MKNKRVYAFIIDMILVTIISTCLSNIEKINPYMLKYEEAVSEYNTVLDDAYNNYVENQDEKEFINKVSKPMYKAEKYSVVEKIIYLITFILYFGLFQYVTGGETLGKRIFKLRVVNEDGTQVSLVKLLLRSLINGNTLFYGFNLFVLIKIISIFTCNSSNFLTLYMPLIAISTICDIVFALFYIIRKDGKGLNDVIFKTKVIERLN